MSEFLEALWGFAATAASWIGWFLWQSVAWVGWLLWQGVLLGTEHWWLTLFGAAAVVICGLIWWIFKLYDEVGRVESQNDRIGDVINNLATAHRKAKEKVQTLTDRLNQSPDDLRRENNFLRAKLDRATIQNRKLDEEIRDLYDQNNRLESKLRRMWGR